MYLILKYNYNLDLKMSFKHETKIRLYISIIICNLYTERLNCKIMVNLFSYHRNVMRGIKPVITDRHLL